MATILLLSTSCQVEEPAPPPTTAEDVSVEAPELAKRLIENDYIAVTRIELAPRQGLPKHKAKDRVVHTLGRYRLRYAPEDGSPKILDVNEGETTWRPAEVQTITNGGATKVLYLTIERKQPYPEPENPSNLISVARGYAGSALNNEDVRVLEVSIRGKARIPNHDSSGRVICAMTPMKMRFTEGSETVEKEFAVGDVHWQEAGRHRAQSLSSEPARFLVIEFKK
ncbi:MAG: hypothetical protein GY953_44110 [bacterium]|nr:hypothetical protein [bacterium]